MPQTEYKGKRYRIRLEEFRYLGAGGMLFRVGYELSKRLGFVERKNKAGKLSIRDVIQSLDLERPDLADVRRAYDSQELHRAIAELIKHFKSGRRPEFFFDWRDREIYQRLLRKHFADQEAQLVEKADRVCRHEFEIFGSNSVGFGDEVNWHLDPPTGSNWPLKHWSQIDLRGPDRMSDVRITWEINRHQFFFTLGRAYWFTGDEKYAREFANLMRGWLDANPPEIGVNWYSNLEIAIRLISWIWAYHYFLDSPHFDDDLHLDFLRIVLQSCRHITRDFQYSLRSMKNNHVIGDAAALVFASIMFPEFKESEHWRKTYMKLLYRELDKQVYNDGVDYEQAVSYHRFVLYFYLLLLRIMQINSYDLRAGLAHKIEKMIQFIMYMIKPDRSMPQIGDSDDARVLILNNDSFADYTSALSTGAVLFRRGDLKWTAGKLNEETFWLGGEESISIFDELKESIPSSLSRGFSEGGYYTMRTGWDVDDKYLLLKCGPHADHGHADALHIELYCNRKSCLRDCGTYTYNGPWEWRTFFRSTRAHNTVMIDGESQSIPHRVFRWIKVARPRAISWVTSRGFDYVDAEHDGYTRYKEPVTHRRAVFFVKPEYWIILDRLIGRGKHSVELLFQMPCGEHELETSAKIFRSEDLAIIPVEPGKFDMNLYECDEEPIRGWFSPCYGIKEPSTTLVYSFTGELPEVMATLLDSESSILGSGLTGAAGNMVINAELGDFRDTVVYRNGRCRSPQGFSKGLNSSRKPDLQTEIDTDAELVYLREDKSSGRITRLALIAGSYIRMRGKTLLNAGTPVKSVDMSVSATGEAEIEVKPGVDIELGI